MYTEWAGEPIMEIRGKLFSRMELLIPLAAIAAITMPEASAMGMLQASSPGLLLTPVSRQYANLIVLLSVCSVLLAILLAIISPGRFLLIIKSRKFRRTAFAVASVWTFCWVFPEIYIRLVLQPRFEGQMAEFLRDAEGTSGPEYIKGKVVVIDRDKRMIDTLHMYLPPEIQANRPEEVGTIVWLDSHVSKVGDYITGSNEVVGGGYTQVTYVTVVDREAHSVIHRDSFAGHMPPKKLEHRGDASGDNPSGNVQYYIESLATAPRK
jgi:hypothetical protein